MSKRLTCVKLSTNNMEARCITIVTFICWTLLICCVSAESAGCSPGWFGSDCQYKCRCTSGYCNKDGLCTSGLKCLRGWFGPACQYADLAYGSTLRLTDGDDSTCPFIQNNKRTVILDYRIPFSWMRVYVSKPDYLQNLTVTFSDGLGCINQRTATVDDNTLDIYCDLPKDVWSVTLTGAGVRYLCSVYISGGRNIALKQKTNQTTTWESYGSEKAVDGNNNRDFENGSCSVTVTKPPPNPWWRVTFSRPSHVNRYVLFTRKGFEQRLQGFILESSDVNNRVVENFKDTTNTTHPVYNVNYVNMRSPISSVLIRNTNSENIVELCEVEIYGETACTPGKYGRECEHTCNCVGGQPCFISTGGCPSGCATGFYGESCDLPCKPERYGAGCKQNCSDFCIKDPNYRKSSCDHVNGSCILGCTSGYEGSACTTACKPGSYGLRCNNSCSEFCAKNSSDERPCDQVSGVCLRGCERGYQKPGCTAPCERGRYGEDCSQTCSFVCKASNKTDASLCHHVTGVCTFGCHSGQQSPFCQQDSQTLNKTDDTGAIVGSVLGVIVLVLIVMAVVFLLRRRWNTTTKMDCTPGREFHKGRHFMNASSASLIEAADSTANNVAEKDSDEDVGHAAGGAPNTAVYYNFVPLNKNSSVVSLDELEDYMATRDDNFFKSQFSAIAVNQEATMTVGMSSENKPKNRYKNICAYDHSRVHLIPNAAKKQGDYINASYIEGYKSDEKFIASQGPTKVMLEDFVRMLWEQDVEKVVMLTNLVEEGKQKCERYWPEDGEMTVGEITVKLTTTQVFADYTIRRLRLLKEGKPSQHLIHFHFTSWPDKDVPNTPWSLVTFEQKVASYPSSKNIVVHCSAGVGRTGTFIALRNVMRQAEESGQMDFFTTVQKLRHDRINMIQTVEQYKFLHRAAQVAMLCIGTTVTARDIANRIAVLDSRLPSGQTKLEKEFKAVCSACDEKEEEQLSEESSNTVYENSQNLVNRQKNRVKNILPKEFYRAKLRCENSEIGDYINAVIVPSFSRNNQQILTQLPLPTTITDFWRLVTQYKVSLIVAFEVHLKDTDQTIGDYLPSCENDVSISSMFTLKTEPVTTGKFWKQQDLDISIDEAMQKCSNVKTEHHLTHLTITSTDLDTDVLLAVTQEIRSRQRGDDEGRTLYMCRNGADYSGLVYVLSLLLDRMDNDQCLTVPLVVGAVKSIRPQVIPTLDQYRLLYTVLKQYSESITEYSNFSSNQF